MSFTILCVSRFIRELHPSKKVTQHDFDRSYFFYPGFLSIKFTIPRKSVYLPFDWCLIILLGLFHWGACRLSKFGVKSKSKTCKMDQSVWEMHVMPSFVLYARVLTAHSWRRNCPKLRRSEWAVGTHAWIQPQ